MNRKYQEFLRCCSDSDLNHSHDKFLMKRSLLSFRAMLTKKTILTALLVFVPISIAAHFLGWGELTVFITSGLAIVPLAAWMGTATEELSVVLGASIGGLLNATFGNATELIIALIALKAGLVDVVQATITGSIIGNLLLVLGFSMLLGGLRYPEQVFHQTAARVNASSLNLAVIAILLPTAANLLSKGISQPTMQRLSCAVSIVLILVYGLMLLFSMRTHTHLYNLELAAIECVETPASDRLSARRPQAAQKAGILDRGAVGNHRFGGDRVRTARRRSRNCHRPIRLDPSLYRSGVAADYWQRRRARHGCHRCHEKQDGAFDGRRGWVELADRAVCGPDFSVGRPRFGAADGSEFQSV